MNSLTRAERAAVASVLAVGCVAMFFPFFWMVTTSIKTESQLVAAPPVLLPMPGQWKNFVTAWTSAAFTQFLVNSLVVAIAETGLSVLFSSMAGYGFAKFEFTGRRAAFLIVLSTLMIPGQITMIPVYLMLRDVGLLNTRSGLVVVQAAGGAFGVFLMRQFMEQVPDELIQAARIDGCGEIRLFFLVVFPLIQPAVAALAIFSFMASWDAFFWPLILLDSESKFTLPIGIARFQGQYDTDVRMIMAVSVVTTLPVFGFFLAFQRNFIEGVSLTGIKG